MDAQRKALIDEIDWCIKQGFAGPRSTAALMGASAALKAAPTASAQPAERETLISILENEQNNLAASRRQCGKFEGARWDALQKVIEYLSAAPAPSASPAALTEIRNKLERFNECAEDDEGVDIGRAWLDALTAIGLLERAQRSPARWEMTDAGNALLSDSASVLADADLDRMWHEVASASGTTVGIHRRFARALLAASPADQAPNLSDACEALRTVFLIGNPLAIGMVRGLASLAKSPRVESYHERKGATNSMSATPPAAEGK